MSILARFRENRCGRAAGRAHHRAMSDDEIDHEIWAGFGSLDTKVAPGRCVTGWVLYPMPEQTRIVRASYGSGADAVAEWLAPKS